LKRIASLAAALTLLALTALPIAAQAPALKTTEFGRGPTVVLVHGLGSGRMQWMPTARKLLAGYHVVMVDLPGHGESPMPDPFTLDAAASALDQVLARQNADSTIVVGQGVGGSIAVLAAQAHPERVRGVVAIDASLISPFNAIPDQQKKYFADYLTSATNEQFAEIMKQSFSRQVRDSSQALEVTARAALVPRANMAAYLKDLIYFDASKPMKDFKRPLLYVGSSKAWSDTTRWATLAKERGYDYATGVLTRRIANSGSQIASDQPDSLAAAIDAFAKQVLAAKQ
jgi:pimeloyl-ACP methyl ester carboxylesterase